MCIGMFYINKGKSFSVAVRLKGSRTTEKNLDRLRGDRYVVVRHSTHRKSALQEKLPWKDKFYSALRRNTLEKYSIEAHPIAKRRFSFLRATIFKFAPHEKKAETNTKTEIQFFLP